MQCEDELEEHDRITIKRSQHDFNLLNAKLIFDDNQYYIRVHYDHSQSYCRWIIHVLNHSGEFVYSMIRLGTLDIYPIVAVDFVGNLIRANLAHHRTPDAAESIIPNPTLQDFVML